MKNLLLFGPFLWFRRVVLWVLILLLLIVLILYFVGNSPLVVKKVVEAFAPDYNISYDSIEGNALSGFEIKNPQYNNKSIAKEIILKWNPNTLVNRQVTVNKLHLKDANIDVIKSLVSAFSSEENSTDEENTSSDSLAFSIELEDIALSAQPFEIEGVLINNATFNSRAIVYKEDKLNIEKFDLNIDSNLTHLYYEGEIKDNQLLGQIVLTPYEELYTAYEIPLRKDAISKILVDINASKDVIIADISTDANRILDVNESAFNVDIDSFKSHVEYDLNDSQLSAMSKANITTAYTKNMRLTNQLTYKDKFKHQGTIHIESIEGVEAKFVKPLENLEIIYAGDDKSIKTTFNSRQIKGYFNSDDFKNADVHMQTREPLLLANLITLPPELEKAKASLIIDAPLNLKDFSKINSKVKLNSDIVNIDAEVEYAEAINIDGKIVIPEQSLIKPYSKDVVWGTLTPMDTNIILKDKQLILKLGSQTIKSNVVYGIESGGIKGKLDVAGLALDISGNTKERLAIKTKIKSVKALDKKLNTLYRVGELPPIEGTIDASVVVDKLQSVELKVLSPKLSYKADKTTTHIIKDVQLVASMNKEALYVKSYQVIFNKQKYFSTKIAKVKLGETLNISNFWINDELQVEGDYTPTLKKGNFTAKAKSFHIKDKVADIYTKINLEATLDGNDTRVEGKVLLLKGNITPQIEGRSFATDGDIIFIQEMQKNKKSSFMDNLSLMLKIDTSNAINVKKDSLSIKLKPDLTINKEKGGELLYLGSVDLIQGGSYIFQEKKFVLAKSAVYFTGDVNKPILDIKAKYKSLNHLIIIAVTGVPEEPNINFSSSPSLTREQILSVILFDSEGSGDTHSGNEMMRMMGGAMAKAALSDVGVKVDHLAFGEGNSIEVGKKISSKATVIYINGEVPKVKLKYQHNKRTESVIGASEESQSYDIIYKRDF